MSSLTAHVVVGLVYLLVLLVGLLSRALPRRRWTPTRRIAVTGTFYNVGWFRSHLVPLSQSGVEQVLVVTEAPLEQLDRVRFACPPPWLTKIAGPTVAKLLALIATGLRHRPDVFVGFHLFPGAASALIAARLMGRAACYQMTGGPIEILGGGWRAENRLLARLSRPSSFLERLALVVVKQFDLVVVRGTQARAFLAARGIRDSVAVITGSIREHSPRPDTERPYDLAFVGRLTEIKRPLLFVDIAARVKRQLPAFRAVVVGDGPLLDTVRQRSIQADLHDSISFLGQTRDAEGVLSRAKVFLLTSRTEGLSIAMLEAMAAGAVPVVADVGELGDLVETGRNGYLVSPDCTDDYVGRVALLLRNSELWSRLSRAAAAAAVSAASVGVVAAKWAEQFDVLVRRLSTGAGNIHSERSPGGAAVGLTASVGDRRAGPS